MLCNIQHPHISCSAPGLWVLEYWLSDLHYATFAFYNLKQCHSVLRLFVLWRYLVVWHRLVLLITTCLFMLHFIHCKFLWFSFYRYFLFLDLLFLHLVFSLSIIVFEFLECFLASSIFHDFRRVSPFPNKMVGNIVGSVHIFFMALYWLVFE